MAQFDQIIPNGAERIQAMVEREQQFRIAHETKVLDAHIGDSRRGNYLGAGITVFAILMAAVTAYLGAHPTVSIAIVGLPLASIIKAMIGNRSRK